MILIRMRQRSSQASLLTDVDPRVGDWIIQAKGLQVQATSLRLTYNLLLRLLKLVDEGSEAGVHASNMCRLAHALLRGLEAAGQEE